MNETVLIVDDEESVRRTFQEWLASSGLGVTVFASPDSESALRIVSEQPIDLAILDWNLGSGSDGLRLLEDIVEFQPDVVAILVTGFAGVATPLQALRMGVRDYLDKNADLNRETFLKAIRHQLDRIRPARQARALNRAATEFRAAVQNVLPLVRTTAAFNDPVPLPNAVRGLLQFLIRVTGATDGALVVRHLATDGSETTAAYDANGGRHAAAMVPFAKSLAASIASHQEPMIGNGAEAVATGAVLLMPFEAGRKAILAAPLPVGGGTTVVLELFDKPDGFTPTDRVLMASAMEIGGDLLRQAFAERQTSRLLFDAVEAALKASAGITDVLQPAEEPLPAAMERLKAGLAEDANATADPETTLRLVEAVRALAVRHGPSAVEHCVRMVTDLRKLLDELTGTL